LSKAIKRTQNCRSEVDELQWISTRLDVKKKNKRKPKWVVLSGVRINNTIYPILEHLLIQNELK
jgi:hypothetical protein